MSRLKKMTVLFLLGIVCLVPANNINTGGHTGVVRAMKTGTLEQTGIHFGASLKFDTDEDYVSGPYGSEFIFSGSERITGAESPQFFSGDFFLAYGLVELLDISVDFPLYWDRTGWGRDRSGIGDLGVSAKLAYPFQKEGVAITQAYFLKVTFPTGDEDRGYFPRHPYYHSIDEDNPGKNQYTAGSILFNGALLYTLHFDRLNKALPLKLHGNIGGVFTPKKNGSAVIGALALEYLPADIFTLFLELSGEARIKWYTESFSVRYFENDPLVLSPGFSFNFHNGLQAKVAVDIGLSSDEAQFRNTWNRDRYTYATAPVPKFGVQLTVSWNGYIKDPDMDNDGVPDKYDYCLKIKEDLDGYKDNDGCPDYDNDNDGILDTMDTCPNETAQCTGCPILDKDKDGITDDEDQCPDSPEDRDNFEDADGCPDLDNDGDKIDDNVDKCPGRPEDDDGFQDEDGCPDLDNDGDGIVDTKDKCPNIKGYPETQGCPKTKEIKKGKLILSGVTFQSGSSILTPNSYVILNQVAESLKEWPRVKLQIQGHTDSQGNAMTNKMLSLKRARAVRQYLTDQGVNPSRLTAVGYGESMPIADNTSAAGRAKNRRVELNRIE